MMMTLEEAREMAELTDRIAANLKYMVEYGSPLDVLEHLYSTTDSIVANMKVVADLEVPDLEDLDKTLGSILESLQYIEQENIYSDGLDELDKTTGRIVGNLKAIADDNTSIDDLEHLDTVTSSIADTLKVIKEDSNDLESLEKTTDRIGYNLAVINGTSSTEGLDALLEKTNAIVANLQTIAESK